MLSALSKKNSPSSFFSWYSGPFPRSRVITCLFRQHCSSLPLDIPQLCLDLLNNLKLINQHWDCLDVDSSDYTSSISEYSSRIFLSTAFVSNIWLVDIPDIYFISPSLIIELDYVSLYILTIETFFNVSIAFEHPFEILLTTASNSFSCFLLEAYSLTSSM